MQNEQLIINVTGLIVLILVLGITIFVLAYNNKQRKSKAFHEMKDFSPIKPERKIKMALLLENEVELVGGITMNYYFDEAFTPPIKVYIKYFNELCEMLNLMYRHNIGFVLVSEERETSPKYYHLEQVYIGKPGEMYVKGYIDDTENFVITEISHTKGADITYNSHTEDAKEQEENINSYNALSFGFGM